MLKIIFELNYGIFNSTHFYTSLHVYVLNQFTFFYEINLFGFFFQFSFLFCFITDIHAQISDDAIERINREIRGETSSMPAVPEILQQQSPTCATH